MGDHPSNSTSVTVAPRKKGGDRARRQIYTALVDVLRFVAPRQQGGDRAGRQTFGVERR